MKANEAPERIWMDSEWIPHFTENSIEYIRKDAFIEKAIAWWEDNFVYTDDVDEKYKNIDDFRKYMEGE